MKLGRQLTGHFKLTVMSTKGLQRGYMSTSNAFYFYRGLYSQVIFTDDITLTVWTWMLNHCMHQYLYGVSNPTICLVFAAAQP